MSQERKKLIKELDAAFSLFIRERDKFKCICCGKDRNTATIQCGHLFSRVSMSTRFSETNSAAQCSGCNLLHEYDFEPFRQAYIKKFGQKQYDLEYVKFKQTTKYSESDLRELIKYYKDKTKKLQEEV
jgi:hypothetical protein